MSVSTDLLPRSTVRIDLRGTPSGTGFFVAPGLIVTCAHVIQPAGKNAPVELKDIAVRSADTTHVVEGVDGTWHEEDLALLRVRTETQDVVALLDAADVQPGDDLISFGYPDDHPEGSPATVELEGIMGSGQLKAKAGQIRPGMSGSPALHAPTGAVCAVWRRTRDSDGAMGGYAEPVSTLLRLRPTLGEENERAQASDPRWTDELSPEQRELWRSRHGGARPGVAPAKHLVVTVSQRDEDWWVGARLLPGDIAIEPERVDLNVVRRNVARIFRSWTARGRWPEREQVRLLGTVLSRALLPGAVGGLVHDRLADEEERVIVNVHFEADIDADLVNLPWEHLYLPEEGPRGEITLAAEQRAGLVRVLTPDPGEPDEPTRSDLSVMLVVARPTAYAGEEAALVHEAGNDVVAAGEGHHGIQVSRLDTPTPADLADALGEGAFDVVHYVGYGCSSEDKDRLALGGPTDSGIDFYEVGELNRCLRQGSAPLVVLQLCPGPKDAVPADFSTLGPSIARAPVPAVVAFQFPVLPKVAKTFTNRLYKALAAGRPVDMAVQEARMQLTFHPDHPRAFASPALFLRQPGELRLARPEPAAAVRDTLRERRPSGAVGFR